VSTIGFDGSLLYGPTSFISFEVGKTEIDLYASAGIFQHVVLFIVYCTSALFRLLELNLCFLSLFGKLMYNNVID